MKKAQELANIAKLKITVVVYDPASNVLQEFNSSSDFTMDNIIEHYNLNLALKIDNSQFKNIRRK